MLEDETTSSFLSRPAAAGDVRTEGAEHVGSDEAEPRNLCKRRILGG